MYVCIATQLTPPLLCKPWYVLLGCSVSLSLHVGPPSNTSDVGKVLVLFRDASLLLLWCCVHGSDGEINDRAGGGKRLFLVAICGGGKNLFFSGGIDFVAYKGCWSVEVEGLMSEGYAAGTGQNREKMERK